MRIRIATDTSSDLFKIFLTVRLRQEEKRQQEETNRVKERKRKREKYAEKVCQVWGGGQGLMGVQSGPYRRGFRVQACRLGYWLVSSSIYVCYTAVLSWQRIKQE